MACADVTVAPRCDCPGHPIKLLNYMVAGRATVCFAGAAKGGAGAGGRCIGRATVCFAGAAKGVTHGHDAWVVADHDCEGLAAEGVGR